MNDEKKVVARSMLVLFLGMAIVYSLTYMKNAPLFTQEMNSSALEKEEENSGWNLVLSGNDESSEVVDLWTLGDDLFTWEKKIEKTIETWTENTIINQWTGEILISSGIEQIPSEDTFFASTGSCILLSGTTEYLGTLDIFDVLGMKALCISRDDNKIYFARFWDSIADIVKKVEQLGGDVHTLSTEKEILDNQLFWDRVSFINLQAYKHKYVLMILEVNGENWLLQFPVENDVYHQKKTYLKSLFI